MNPHTQIRREAHHHGEDGYVLLTLLLAVALIIIFAAAVVPTIKFQMERDREEEMIHRGVQYARAIRAYYKKFGRYPTKIEDLESTNNLRFLRKRYKDPTNCSQGKCQDFKLLHFGDVKLTFTGGIGGGTIPGASPAGSPADQSGQSAGLGQSSAFGGSTGFGGNATAGNSGPGADSSQSSSHGAASQTAGSDSSASGGDAASGGSGDKLSGQVFGGGPIVGVASLTKKKGYREFNHKKKYNEWQFIYDPGTDRGGLIMTPYQPQLQGFGQQGMQNSSGQNSGGSNSNNGSSFGSSSFGSPSGTQNNPGAGGFGAPSQPSNPQQQQ